ncbi:MAG: D-lyxose/D-mannose family sugar isomerase [Clostridiaceae bacterium]|nr:D-lyxose/D-mannose family sugar isomerase [Clostridiaceae bacterium]
MIKRDEYVRHQKEALEYIEKANVVISNEEKEQISVNDFGLNDLANQGAEILTFFNTDRISYKIIVLLPGQTLPEHWHPPMGDDPGKEEIMRVRSGEVYLYVSGEPTENIKAKVPKKSAEYYTVYHQITMRPGEQVILNPGVIHWFQSGPEGAVIDDYSTCARDILDGFTDPNVKRITEIEE